MKPIRYVLYARKSSESEDRQVQSIEDQLHVMRDLVKKQNLKVVLELHEAKSAKAPFQRPQFQKMIDMIKNGEADGIIVWSINRLSRNPAESGLIQQMLQDEDIRSIQTSGREYLSDDNAVVLGVESSMSNQYVRELSKNVMRGMAKKIRDGGIPGVAMQGYYNDRVNKTIEKDPERFPLIRKAFDMYLTGLYSVQQVLSALNDDWGYTKCPTQRRGGQKLKRTALYCILRNKKYAGKIEDPHNKGHFFDSAYEPMITVEEYDKVQRILGAAGSSRICASKQYALKGFIRCGECNCFITAETKSKNLVDGTIKEYVYYHCTRRGKKPCEQRKCVREEILFDQLNDLLDSYELPPKLYEWGMKALDELAKKEISERDKVQDMQHTTIKGIQKQLDNLLDLVSRDVITADDYKTKSESLNKELVKRQEEQASVSERTRNWYEHVGKTLQDLTNANEKFTNGDIADKRDIVQAIGQNPVIIDGSLVLEPYEWLNPVRKALPEIKARLAKVRTNDLLIEKKTSLDEEKALMSLWCTT